MPGYDTFRKLISNKILAISIVVTLFFIVNAIFDARRVLKSPYSHSVLIVAPVMVVAAFVILFPLLSKILAPKRKVK